MKQIVIVGVDVSKATLDLFIKPFNMAQRVTNKLTGYKKWLKEITSLVDANSKILVIMEHTGLYSNRFELFLQSMSIDYCKVPALQIKRSMGVVRGKNDKIDAERIADYAWIRRDILSADKIPGKQITELRQLLSLRSKLVKDRSGYITRLKEMKAAGYFDFLPTGIQEDTIKFLSMQIDSIEGYIRKLITSNAELKTTCDLLRSIKGIGWIIAAYMIGCTDNFKRFSNARKFNCYAGLAPFKNESGTSIKGRSRVSHLANKDAKTLLNLAASCAIRCDQELKQYYQKRVSEGKRKMSCLNIIRSKIVARMFAVIKRQSPYQDRLIAA
jgi:transposase